MEEEDKIPPLLKGLKKRPEEQLGKIPEGYFENFEMRLMEKIAAENQALSTVKLPESGHKKVLKLRPAYIMGIAAGLLLLILAGTWYLRGNNPLDYKQIMALNVDNGIKKLELAEANDFLIINIDELDPEDLAENLDDSDLSGLNKQFYNTDSNPADSLPPIKKEKEPLVQNENDKKENQPQLKDEIMDDMAAEADFEELLKELDDNDLKSLEAALLKPKKKPN